MKGNTEDERKYRGAEFQANRGEKGKSGSLGIN